MNTPTPAAADALLAQQIEWAEALHSWETIGLMYKPGRGDPVQAATFLIAYKNVAEEQGRELSPQERDVIDKLWAHILADLKAPALPSA